MMQLMIVACVVVLPRTSLGLRAYDKQVLVKSVTNSIKELIRIADVSTSIEECVKEKYKHNAETIDVKARDVFSTNKVSVSMIACSYGFNH